MVPTSAAPTRAAIATSCHLPLDAANDMVALEVSLAALVKDQVVHWVVVSLGENELVGCVASAGVRKRKVVSDVADTIVRRSDQAASDLRVVALDDAMNDRNRLMSHLVNDDVADLERVVPGH